ncbi:MAG: hypothetical protein M3015_03395 [Bacteroidota bacterium]|nr:hypothetical protein [Bacteroidota bacterium]
MDTLIYGEEYFCFHVDEYLGTATFVDDPLIGESFAKMEVHEKRGLKEIIIMPDRWIMKVTQDC